MDMENDRKYVVLEETVPRLIIDLIKTNSLSIWMPVAIRRNYHNPSFYATFFSRNMDLLK